MPARAERRASAATARRRAPSAPRLRTGSAPRTRDAAPDVHDPKAHDPRAHGATRIAPPIEAAPALARALRAIGRALVDAPAPFDPDRLDLRDVALIDEVRPALEWIADEWLTLRVDGAEHLRTAPALIVGNHNGGIMGPDLFCTMSTLWRAGGTAAPLYAMAHDLAMRHVVPLGRLLQRIGAIRAHPDNARRALGEGARVLVYPGGELDAYRHFRLRNRVVFGERTGFVHVAREARAPIVPIVAYGAHRSAIILHEGEWLAGALGLTRWSRIRRFPIALALPWLVGAGPWVPYLPLPLPIRLRVLPPIEVSPRDDPRVVQGEVVARMQRAMDRMVAEDR